MPLIINLFGAPSAGKSKLASELFAMMKAKGMRVELVTEVAKDLVHEEQFDKLKECQDWVSAEQNFRLWRARKYDYIITDSPLLLGLFYIPPNYYPSMKQVIVEKFNSYNNINFYIERNFPYDPDGRTQDELGADKLAMQIGMYLKHNEVPHYRFKHDDRSAQKILNVVTANVCDVFNYQGERIGIRNVVHQGVIGPTTMEALQAVPTKEDFGRYSL